MIVQFKNPVTGEVTEKHSKQSSETMGFFDDKRTHLFTLREFQLQCFPQRSRSTG